MADTTTDTVILKDPNDYLAPVAGSSFMTYLLITGVVYYFVFYKNIFKLF